jgi:hypothetical protein
MIGEGTMTDKAHLMSNAFQIFTAEAPERARTWMAAVQGRGAPEAFDRHSRHFSAGDRSIPTRSINLNPHGLVMTRSSNLRSKMWTPPQWPIAFPATAAVMALCLLVIIWGDHYGSSWLVGIGSGIVAGLCLSIGWTLRPLITPLAIFFVFTALLPGDRTPDGDNR